MAVACGRKQLPRLYGPRRVHCVVCHGRFGWRLSWLRRREPVCCGRRPMTNREKMLQAVTDSLRNTISIRDFIVAVEAGARIATEMLDRCESRLIDALQELDEDFGR
jgi:hypothetical protein